MKFIYSNKLLDPDLTRDFDSLRLIKNEKFNLLINDPSTITETSELLSVTNGYLKDSVKDDRMDQNISAAEHAFHNWPVKDNITGSFSSLIINKKDSEIVICTDLTNIYPLYYRISEDNIFISNSIILLGRYTNTAIDNTGLFQRAVGPNFQNIGSRTILKSCKSLLPGEWLKIKEGVFLENRFDNTLYQNIGAPHFKESMLTDYWNQYKLEVALCTNGFTHTNIALSGGIDSRIVLGAISDTQQISAFTFGEHDNYESVIARKLARKKRAQHRTYFDSQLYFPNSIILSQYCKETEAVKLNSWLEILENIKFQKKQPILLGELCEGLPGRNIKTFNSSNFRNKNFLKYYIKNDDFPFTSANPENFETWKKSKKRLILSWHDDNWFEKLQLENYKDEIIKNTISDTEEIFDRIAAHNLPFAELYDELYSWYTFTRMELSKQVNICNEKFYASSPGMSLQMLKKTSNIHPNLRLYYRFANELLNKTQELKKFRNIPTSQIPIIPQHSPNFIKIPIWGFRSKIDDWLVKRLMKSKNIAKKYRLFKSINWVKVYQQPDMLKNIESYYCNNHLSDEYYQTFYRLAEKRKDLITWPFANMDIMSGAALNTELDLIKNYPK